MNKHTEKKTLFLHIPKTGGTYINQQFIKNKIHKQTIFHKILKYEKSSYNEYYKFSVIRDPVKKLISLYFYHINTINNLIEKKNLKTHQDGNWNIIYNLYKKYNIVDIYTFLDNYKTFYDNEIKPEIPKLKQYNKNKNMCFFYLVGYLPQYLFLCDDNYNILVNEIVNTDDIDTFLLNKFKINKINKLNTHKNTNDDYYKYASNDNINVIKEIYKNDYKYLFKDNVKKYING